MEIINATVRGWSTTQAQAQAVREIGIIILSRLLDADFVETN